MNTVLKVCTLWLHLHWIQCNKVINSPHAGFCFLFRTQSSPGEHSESTVTSRERVKMELLLAFLLQVDISKKPSSLAPITPNTPTQACTNTKQMNHQCGGMSLPLFLCQSSSLGLQLSRARPLSLPPLIFPTYIFLLTPYKQYPPERLS